MHRRSTMLAVLMVMLAQRSKLSLDPMPPHAPRIAPVPLLVQLPPRPRLSSKPAAQAPPPLLPLHTATTTPMQPNLQPSLQPNKVLG